MTADEYVSLGSKFNTLTEAEKQEFIDKLDDYEIILKNTSISADKVRVVREKILKEYQNELHD